MFFLCFSSSVASFTGLFIFHCHFGSEKLENIEWAITKGQSRDTGHIGCEHMMERRKTKQNTTTLNTKNMSDTDSAIKLPEKLAT
jgi:hypothetical protein